MKQTSGSGTFGVIDVDNEAEITGILQDEMRTDRKNNINQPRYCQRKVKQTP